MYTCICVYTYIHTSHKPAIISTKNKQHKTNENQHQQTKPADRNLDLLAGLQKILFCRNTGFLARNICTFW